MSAEETSSISKPKSSWIWQYFKVENKEIKKGEESVNVSVMICQVKKGSSSSEICGTEYIRKDSSTGNAISHLRAKHSITQPGKVSIIR